MSTTERGNGRTVECLGNPILQRVHQFPIVLRQLQQRGGVSGVAARHVDSSSGGGDGRLLSVCIDVEWSRPVYRIDGRVDLESA